MSICQGARELFKDLVSFCYIYCPALCLQLIQALLQRTSIDQLHYNVDMTILLPGIMHHHNVRVGEARHQFRFQVKAFHKTAVGCIPWREDLHRYFTIQVLLMCSVDAGHTSLPQRGKDSIIPQRCTNELVCLQGSHSLIAPTTLALGENQHCLTKLDLVPLLQWIRLEFRNQLSIDFSAVSTTFILQAIVPISHIYNGSVET